MTALLMLSIHSSYCSPDLLPIWLLWFLIHKRVLWGHHFIKSSVQYNTSNSVYTGCVHHPHWNNLYALIGHTFTSASASPRETLWDTVTHPWTLSQLCWWLSMAGVVWLQQRRQVWGWVRNGKGFAPSPLVIFIKDSTWPWGNLWNEDFTHGRWVKVEWWGREGTCFHQGSLHIELFAGTRLSSWGGCVVPHTRVPSVQTSCVFCSGFVFSCIL